MAGATRDADKVKMDAALSFPHSQTSTPRSVVRRNAHASFGTSALQPPGTLKASKGGTTPQRIALRSTCTLALQVRSMRWRALLNLLEHAFQRDGELSSELRLLDGDCLELVNGRCHQGAYSRVSQDNRLGAHSMDPRNLTEDRTSHIQALIARFEVGGPRTRTRSPRATWSSPLGAANDAADVFRTRFRRIQRGSKTPLA